LEKECTGRDGKNGSDSDFGTSNSLPERLPVSPTTRVDENHGQITSDVYGDNNREGLGEIDSMSPKSDATHNTILNNPSVKPADHELFVLRRFEHAPPSKQGRSDESQIINVPTGQEQDG
jgi:hypothetical protein